MRGDLSRREVLVLASLPLCAQAAAQPQSLTAAELSTLALICDRIIPEDEWPGARKANVVTYIDRQLKGPLERYLRLYRDGLTAFAVTHPTFADMSPDQRSGALAGLERSQVRDRDWRAIAPSTFLNMVVDHTMQGFYGSPGHGGNADAVSWKMLGVADLFGHTSA
jgi:gluconate 2-dehydrogenase gamma chain